MITTLAVASLMAQFNGIVPEDSHFMSSTSFKQSMRRLWALDKFSYSIRVFIALTGSMALCWYQDEMTLLIPLFLGIIASALARPTTVGKAASMPWQ